MSYRVMVGAPTADLENSLTARFDELPECDVVSVHHSSTEILNTLGELSGLDVVLVHETLGPLPVMELIRDISRNHPQLAVILLVDEVEPDTFTRVMEAGARGVLATDATIEELDARVTTAGEWSQTLRRHLEAASSNVPVSGRRGSIVTLTGAKGGVGTTVTALQLALTAARAGQPVCLVDLDLQTGDIPSYLDLRHRRSIVDLVEAADTISASMLSETLYVHPEGAHILLAPGDGERGEEVTERAARQILGALRSRYELVIVDCGASMTEAGAMAVELADTAVVTVSPDMPALRGAQRLIAMWGRLQVRDKKDVTTLLLRHSRRNEIQPDFARKLLGASMLNITVPALFRELEEASNTGNPNRITDETLLKSFSRVAGELGLLPAGSDRDDTSSSESGTDDAAPPSPPVERAGSLRGRMRQTRSDRGAQFVEFAAVIPLLGLCALLVWQVLLFGVTSMYAGHAAAEGARQAAVTPNDFGKITGEAAKRVREPWNSTGTFALDIDHRPHGSFVTVSLAMPAVLPSTASPWTVSADARIVYE